MGWFFSPPPPPPLNRGPLASSSPQGRSVSSPRCGCKRRSFWRDCPSPGISPTWTMRTTTLRRTELSVRSGTGRALGGAWKVSPPDSIRLLKQTLNVAASLSPTSWGPSAASSSSCGLHVGARPNALPASEGSCACDQLPPLKAAVGAVCERCIVYKKTFLSTRRKRPLVHTGSP